MPLTRTPHWDTHELQEFFRARRKTPFAWGVNDCCLFPADAIKAFTGVDIAADFRGKYSDQAGAFALIKSVTGTGSTVEDAAAYCAAKHGLVEWTKGPLFAKRGDLVVIRNGGNLIAGIIHLNGRDVISVAESGLVRLPTCSETEPGNIVCNLVRAWAV